jgi:selenocysteine-specific elongation factor
VQTKVKSIQVFRKPVEKAFQGDRCGICISNFDSKQFERGIVSSLNYVKTCYGVILRLNRIKYYKSAITSGSKFHISMGHETILGKIELFAQDSSETQAETFDFSREYIHIDEINEEIQNKCVYAFVDFNYENSSNASGVLCVMDSLLIGSRLDTDIHLNTCRIAFYGHVLHMFTSKDYKEPITLSKSTIGTASQMNSHLTALKVYKNKHKEGLVERRHDEFTLIGKTLFKKETNIDLFVGMKVSLSTGESGYIEASFGQSGKFKVRIQGNKNDQNLKCALSFNRLTFSSLRRTISSR